MPNSHRDDLDAFMSDIEQWSGALRDAIGLASTLAGTARSSTHHPGTTSMFFKRWWLRDPTSRRFSLLVLKFLAEDYGNGRPPTALPDLREEIEELFGLSADPTDAELEAVALLLWLTRNLLEGFNERPEQRQDAGTHRACSARWCPCR